MSLRGTCRFLVLSLGLGLHIDRTNTSLAFDTRRSKATLVAHMGDCKDLTCYRSSGYESAGTPLTILTMVRGLTPELTTAIWKNRVYEADLYGYEYCQFSQNFNNSRPPAWSKISAIMELFKQGRPAVAWMDSDALIFNFQPFEPIVKKYVDAGKSTVFTTQHWGSPTRINSGVFYSKNTEDARNFWQMVYYDMAPKMPKGENASAPWDQEGLNRLHNRHFSVWNKTCAIIDRKIMNAMFPGGKSSFVVHSQTLNFANIDAAKFKHLFALYNEFMQDKHPELMSLDTDGHPATYTLTSKEKLKRFIVCWLYLRCHNRAFMKNNNPWPSKAWLK